MFKYMNLKDRFYSNISFDDGAGAGSGGDGGQGEQGTGQIDYAALLSDPKAQEAFANSEFGKKLIQSAEDKMRTKHTGEKKTLEQMYEDLKKNNDELMNFKRESEKISILKEMNVPLEFWDIIQAGETEVVKTMAKKLLEAHGKLLTSQVEEKFKANGTNPGGNPGGTTITKEQFSKMTYIERMKIYNENKPLYDELVK